MYSITDSGLPSESERQTATSSAASRSGTSERRPSSMHRVVQVELVDQRLDRPAGRGRRRRSAPSRPGTAARSGVGRARPGCRSPSGSAGSRSSPTSGASGGDAELGAHVACRVGGGSGEIPFGTKIVSSGLIRSIVDHAPLVLARDRDERVAAARDQLAVEEHLQPLALERPAVLVRDDDRHAARGGRSRRPRRWRRTCARGRRRPARAAAAGTSGRQASTSNSRAAVEAQEASRRPPPVGATASSTVGRSRSSSEKRVAQTMLSKRAGSSRSRDLHREPLGAAVGADPVGQLEDLQPAAGSRCGGGSIGVGRALPAGLEAVRGRPARRLYPESRSAQAARKLNWRIGRAVLATAR